MSQQEKPSPLLRDLPSIDELLALEPFASIVGSDGHKSAVSIARISIDRVRQTILAGSVRKDREQLVEAATRIASEEFARENSRRIKRVINATGVVIHTNLGRSVVSIESLQAIERNSGYCTLEYDILGGSRGKRGAGAEALLCRLTGSEAAMIVNNCAAAAFLVLRVLAQGKDVVISRGELVEIGGDFRVPDVLAESGAVLREVGTTNRTKLSDYEKAVSERTGLILRVHPSNYRVIGFTEFPANRELAKFGRDHGIPFFEDAGSGALVDLSEFGLNEPTISNSVADGVDVVAFSGDKLFGGVQAGFIVGRSEYIERIRRHPLYRALRVDKLAYSAIEATLASYARGTHFDDIPTLRMLALKQESIRNRAEAVIKGFSGGVRLDIVEGESVVGGGAAPDIKPKTWLISVSVADRSATDVDGFMRARRVPLIGRIADDQFLIDLRTVSLDEQPEVVAALAELAQEF